MASADGRTAQVKADGNVEIYVAAADGDNQTNLTKTDVDEWYDPVWSSEGLRIAFESTRDGNTDIYVMDPTGENLTRWTSSPANDFGPAWIP